jgi:uncharacterized OB-fold protein
MTAPGDLLLPGSDDDSAPFWDATVRGELRMQACGRCGRLRFPPRPNVVVVTLDEDPTLRLVGNLVTSAEGAIGEVDPAAIEIGAPVRVVFAPLTDEVALPRWVRA